MGAVGSSIAWQRKMITCVSKTSSSMVSRGSSYWTTHVIADITTHMYPFFTNRFICIFFLYHNSRGILAHSLAIVACRRVARLMASLWSPLKRWKLLSLEIPMDKCSSWRSSPDAMRQAWKHWSSTVIDYGATVHQPTSYKRRSAECLIQMSLSNAMLFSAREVCLCFWWKA